LGHFSYLRDNFGSRVTPSAFRQAITVRLQERLTRMEQENFELRETLSQLSREPEQANLATAVEILLSMPRPEAETVLSALEAGKYSCTKLVNRLGVSRTIAALNALGYCGAALVEENELITTPLGMTLLNKIRAASEGRQNTP